MQFNTTSGSRRLCAALLCFAAFASSARGQTSQESQPSQETGDVVRISTELVQTDVTVVDKQGRFVDDLKREQFELRVDGKPVPISFFERVGTFGAPAAKAANRSAPGRGRKIIFFLDDLHLAADSVEHVRKSLLQFVENNLGENDQVAVVSASGQVGFLQQFTEHKSVLRAAVMRLKHRPKAVQDTGNPPLTEYVALKIAQGDRDALTFYANDMLRSLQFTYALPKYGGKGAGYMAGSESDQAERMVMQRAQAILAQSAANSLATFSALENFLRASAHIPGRKHVLFISDGFFMHGSAGFTQKLQRITDAAARSGSVIYAVNARAFARRSGADTTKLDALGRLDKLSSGESEASQAAMAALAENTGGRALLDSDNFGAAASDALLESFNYYLLAWRPETESQKAERFRQTRVSIAGRPDLTVRVPRGFLEGETNAQKKTAGVKSTATDLQTATVSFSPKHELPTRLSAEFLNTPDNGMILTASTQIAVDALGYGDSGRQAAAIDLAGVILNDQGAPASTFSTRLNVDPLSAEQAQAQSPSVIYNYRAPLKPGIYQVRVAARDDRSGRVGRAAEWIEIPDLARGELTLSSLFLGGQEIQSGASQAGAAAKRTIAPQMQFSVDHRFKAGSRLSFFFFIYNAALGSGQSASQALTAEINVLRDAKVVLTIPPQPVPIQASTDMRRIPYGGSFPLRSLPSGSYVLRVSVKDGTAQTRASRDVRFHIE
jgi:VWFA-related protein